MTLNLARRKAAATGKETAAKPAHTKIVVDGSVDWITNQVKAPGAIPNAAKSDKESICIPNSLPAFNKRAKLPSALSKIAEYIISQAAHSK
ncbi:MAG: hypothetical protein BWX66_01352 [Deltaproteobacteria bacterium ADurb.Bin058]|nr:MAG: hypothetical protein BWX66_01352 [Deltaproteobacteria bacterium ADurb.Bin058]